MHMTTETDTRMPDIIAGLKNAYKTINRITLSTRSCHSFVLLFWNWPNK